MPDHPIAPFGSFTPALKHLSLMAIPLYPPFLRLRTLADLTLLNYRSNLHLDIILDFLEENRSLECATLNISLHSIPSEAHDVGP